MNTQIKAVINKVAKIGYDDDNNELTTMLIGSQVEKFAELIIKECANAIVSDSRLNDVRSASNGCVRTIKEHFGVE